MHYESGIILDLETLSGFFTEDGIRDREK